MGDLLDTGIAATVHSALKDFLLDVTFIKVTKVSDGSGGFTETTASHSCKGMIDTYSDFYRVQGMVPHGDQKLLILQNSLSVTPELEDRATIRGQTFKVVGVAKDPADATWELQARPWA